MKVFFLITLVMAVAVCTHGNEPVNDSAGNPLEIGKEYFIQPVSSNGGGLVPAAITIIPLCPLGIVQTILPYQPGVPVGFALPPGAGSTVITSLGVNIEFRSTFGPFCTEYSKFWEVDDSPSAQKERAVLIGGKREERNSTFEIEKAGDGAGANTYKLTTFYGTVGTKPSIIYFGAPELIITNDAAKTLLVKFKKVDDATTATTSTSRVDKLGLRMFPFY